MTQRRDVAVFGGSWIPARALISSELGKIGKTRLAKSFEGPEDEDLETVAYAHSPIHVQKWVDIQREENPDIKRGDKCTPIDLPTIAATPEIKDKPRASE